MKDPGGKEPYRELRRYTVVILCVAAAIPAVLIGGGIYLEYRRSLRQKVTTELVSVATHHKESIEGFLRNITAAMRVVATTQSLQSLSQPETLQHAFDTLQKHYDYAFEDLGIIDATGNHVAYIGPYDLHGRNYSETAWFKETMEKKIFLSDVFLGFRQVPHFIIAVKQGEGNLAWILRATVSTAKFGALVENVRLGRTGNSAQMSTMDWWLDTNTHARAGMFSRPAWAGRTPAAARRILDQTRPRRLVTSRRGNRTSPAIATTAMA